MDRVPPSFLSHHALAYLNQAGNSKTFLLRPFALRPPLRYNQNMLMDIFYYINIIPITTTSPTQLTTNSFCSITTFLQKMHAEKY